MHFKEQKRAWKIKQHIVSLNSPIIERKQRLIISQACNIILKCSGVFSHQQDSDMFLALEHVFLWLNKQKTWSLQSAFPNTPCINPQAVKKQDPPLSKNSKQPFSGGGKESYLKAFYSWLWCNFLGQKKKKVTLKKWTSYKKNSWDWKHSQVRNELSLHVFL